MKCPFVTCDGSDLLRQMTGLVLLSGAVASVGGAQPDRVDKAQYNLFSPVPASLLREMSTDRPDKTESPFTVDAGHFQVELDLVSYFYDRYNADHTDVRAESWSVAPVNLKLGLLNNVDIQLVLQTYNEVRERDKTSDSTERHSGFGDMIARVKINCWGDDGGKTAFATMPFLKLPTNQDHLGNDAVEGGMILPLAVSLPKGWDMGAMTVFAVAQDSSDSDYHPEFVNSVTFSHSIVGPLNGYLEFFSAVSTESARDWIGTVDFGFTYALTENIQLDAGMNIGVTRAADDLNPFVGFSIRF